MNEHEVIYGRPETFKEDLPDLVKWLEYRVSGRQGAHPVEMAFLALLGAEACVYLIEQLWSYEEDRSEFVGRLRTEAKRIVSELYGSTN